ncbi:MAG TPA: LuxR C-terminal-related transcriptional regulator [Polyangiaceae bacterium]|nr:LuxR C-terminal-related transcriptional regulator [Polyangiaceae bacterium]
MGTAGFRAFTRRAARASSAAGLGESIIDFGGSLVGARYSGLNAFALKGGGGYTNLPTYLVARYEAHGRSDDRVLAAVTRSHAPSAASIRELSEYARKHNKSPEYMALLDSSVGHHYMLAPVVVGGALVGTLNFARKEDRAFGARELAMAGAMALHVSTRLSTLRVLDRGPHPSWSEVVSARGLEVAELAVRGLTTAEMGRMLGVSPNTVKKHLRVLYERLGVGTRAELATLLARR